MRKLLLLEHPQTDVHINNFSQPTHNSQNQTNHYTLNNNNTHTKPNNNTNPNKSPHQETAQSSTPLLIGIGLGGVITILGSVSWIRYKQNSEYKK